jgi:serine protease AprX
MGALGAASLALAALIVTAAPSGAATAPSGTATASSKDLVAVIIEGAPERSGAAVARAGGVVDQQLPIINGLRARVPADAVAALRSGSGVGRVSTDGTLRAMDEKWGDDTTGEGKKATLATGTWKADQDGGSAFTIAKYIGAQTVWGKTDPNNGNRKLTGHGVAVALIDTGISPVEGLTIPGKVIKGPDLSFDSQGIATRYLDGYGHGTHMAGLIAGRDGAASAGNEADAKHFVGMAPDARLVNIKAGAADGGVDVSQVVAGIDWVVTNRAKHNIRVLNLSYGTDATQSPALDPLAHAVENAWRAGIVVVVAAGNDGESGPRPLTMPAIDPYVIAVGSSDHRGSDKPENARVGTWTNSGSATRRPDILAPGKSVVSLRVPGSWADVGHPEGLVPGDTSGRLFRGTGTSQSAAVVSGAAALLVQRNPSLTPDQVKGLLKATADRLMMDTSPVQGAGVVDIKGAVEALEKGASPAYTQAFVRSTGTGSLEASRGGSHVTDPANGVVLRGETDIFGRGWNAKTWAAASSARTAWTGGTWRGNTLTGPTWASTGEWPTVTWSDASWSRMSWRDYDWSRMSWRADSWSRMSWRGDDWSRMSWRGNDWSRMSWRVAEGW